MTRASGPSPIQRKGRRVELEQERVEAVRLLELAGGGAGLEDLEAGPGEALGELVPPLYGDHRIGGPPEEERRNAPGRRRLERFAPHRRDADESRHALAPRAQ